MTATTHDADQRIFKILSIDGGGIKGLYSATILRHFEEQFGGPIGDYFDLLCGTSTGGLIALAASLKIPMATVCDFYVSQGPRIFPSFWPIPLPSFTRGDFQQIFWGGKFSDRALKKALAEMFGDKIIGDSYNLLCIPSYLITEARPWVFKYDHPEGKLSRDNQTKYQDVALATSAAPTYLPVADIAAYDDRQFIDGGVWANNPSLVGLLEALDYFVGKGKAFQNIKLMSVSSLQSMNGKPVGLKRNRSFVNWKQDLFETSLTGQSQFTDYFLKKTAGITEVAIDYLRIPSSPIAEDQLKHIQLDVATPIALHLIRGKGNDMGLVYRKRDEVASYFQAKKGYQTKNS